MERYDVSEGARLAEMVEAARLGGEVEIIREGTVVARLVHEATASHSQVRETVIDWEKLDDLHRSLPIHLLGGDAGQEISRMRDEYGERLLRR